MQRLVILGGGTAGTMMANKLRKAHQCPKKNETGMAESQGN